MPSGERPSRTDSTRQAPNLTFGGRFRRLVEAGAGNATRRPEGRLARTADVRSVDYQLPLLGHAPLPVVVHVRVTAPVAGAFVIVNVLPDLDVATIA